MYYNIKMYKILWRRCGSNAASLIHKLKKKYKMYKKNLHFFLKLITPLPPKKISRYAPVYECSCIGPFPRKTDSAVLHL